MKMSPVKRTAYIAMGIALYTVMMIFLRIPVVNRIRTDFGYAVYGVYLAEFGVQAIPVGVFGCMLGNMLSGGSLPFAWMAGQAVTGWIAGSLLPKNRSTAYRCLIVCLAVFAGIALVKTGIESAVFALPLWAKFLSNLAAAVTDAAVMCLGVILQAHLRK